MDEKETLRKMGLTEYESQVVLALLSFGSAKVGEIAKKCSVPKNKIYESLGSLLKRGVVKEIPSTPKRYFIKSVDDFGILIKEKQEELELMQAGLGGLKEVEKNKCLAPVNEPVGIIYGHQAFVSKLKASMEKVSKENLVAMRKARTDPVVMRLTKEAIKRGAKIKMITLEKNKKFAKEWRKIGVRIRYVPEISEMTFSTFDDKVCRLNLNITDNLSDPTLWIENKAFINLLRDKFKSLWEEAKR